MTSHCCDYMRSKIDWDCGQHDDPFECPDALVYFNPRFQEYGIIIHDGGTATIRIQYCPWCGSALGESQRDRWFDELERRGIDPSGDDIPPEFTDGTWLR